MMRKLWKESAFTTGQLERHELTVFTLCIPVLMMLVSADLFHNPVQKIIEEFVRILVHGTPEELVDLLELVDEGARGDGAFV